MHHRASRFSRLARTGAAIAFGAAALSCQGNGYVNHETVRGHPLLRNKDIVVSGPTVTTRSAQAQSHFEAGLRSYYEGNRDAAASFFQTATELDPGCAMCFWGIALASAPVPGAPEDPVKASRAAAAIQSAKQLQPMITAPERLHIDAVALLVTSAGGPDLAARRKSYARAMQSLAAQYPGDLDAVTLAAEAVLVEPASAAQTPSKGVSAGPSDSGDALQALRGVLATDPSHPGAQRLYDQTLRKTLLVKWQAALMAGQEAQAMAAAKEIEHALSDDTLRGDPDLQGIATAKMFTLVRFGHWKEILALPAPEHDLYYLTGMWYYSRGLSFTRLGQYLDVPPEQARLDEAAEHLKPDQTVLGTTNAKKQLQIASLVLDAEIEHMRAHRENAIKQIHEAVKLEDSLGNPRPPAFYVPTRQIYGAILLWNDRPREAEKVFREDLERNPENGWSLLGLSQSLQAQKRVPEATDMKMRAQRALTAADVKPPTSVF